MEMPADLLRRRLEIIGDHACRDSDPDGHVEALKTVSLEITVTHQRLAGQLPKRLDHFLERCSFDKALEFLEQAAQ
jgi:hypothetical protein